MGPSHIIEEILERFKLEIGSDFGRYRNHIYRVFNNCLMMDSNSGNEEKYAIASVFHDIGIWTDQTFDYLEPSEHQAKLYLSEEGKQAWIEEIIAMIHFHHKLTPYRDRHENTVETFRKADWIDVSLGLIAFGYNRQTIKTNRNSFPNRGFHFFLLKETSKNIFKHPTRPLPMFMK